MITPIGHDRVSRARRRLQIARLRVAAFPEEGAVPAIGCKDLFPLIRVSNVSAFFIFYRLWFWSYSEVGEISPPVSEFYPYYFNSGCGVFTDLVIFSDFRGTRLFHHTPAPQRSDRHVPCYPRGGWEFRRFAIPTGGEVEASGGCHPISLRILARSYTSLFANNKMGLQYANKCENKVQNRKI